VSPARYEEYDPSDQIVIAHNNALEVMRKKYHCAVLPFRFSTVAKSEPDIMKILDNGYFKFKQKLRTVRGRVEMAVKVYVDIPALRQAIAAETNIKNSATLQKQMRKRTYNSASALVKKLDTISVDRKLNEILFEDQILNAT
jgi:hypothetical protein